MEKIADVKKINKMRCIASLISCIIMIVLVMVAVTINLSDALHRDVENIGLRTLRMFTTLSNLIVAFAAILCIPYQIEGFRKNNYHLPNWIVTTLYMGVTGVAVTFFTAITAITIASGFYVAMLDTTNLFLHTLNPIMAIILFTFINDDHTVSFKKCFISLIPFFIYSIAYIILVFIIGESSGGWTDHYRFNKFIPWPITLIIMYGLGFGVSNLIRFLHNLTHKKRKQAFIRYYQLSDDIKSDTIEEAIKKLAIINKKDYKGGDIIIPRRSIRMMLPVYNQKKNIKELYKIYIDNYVDDNNL